MESNSVIRVINKIVGVRFVNHEYDYGPKMDDSEVLIPINHNHYNFWENKCIPAFLVKELLIPIIQN